MLFSDSERENAMGNITPERLALPSQLEPDRVCAYF